MHDEPPVIQHPAFESLCRDMRRQTRQQICISIAIIVVMGAIVAGLGMLNYRYGPYGQGDRSDVDTLPAQVPSRVD
jgi:hypothetical protein